MGLYFRRSVSVSPLRFNFSKSGIGVSAGIPGFRIGTGPRGHYVHMGGGGIYYRATLPQDAAVRSGRTPPAFVAQSNAGYHNESTPGIGSMRAVESGSVLAIADETAADLLMELESRRAAGRAAPWIAVLGAVAPIAALAVGANAPVVVALFLVALAAFALARWNDALRKTTVVAYQLDEAAMGEFERLVAALGTLHSSDGLWHVAASAEVYDQKRNAGADNVVRRSRTRVSTGLPPFVKSNIDVPTLSVGRQTLFFFPDRVLVFDAGRVGAVSYADIRTERRNTRFIENETPPRDSRVVGQTWQYVNKSGGPDRRFKNNKQLPVMEYEEFHITSTSGLNELLQVSRVGSAEALETEIRRRRSRGNQ